MPKAKETLVADNDDATEWCHEKRAHVIFGKHGCVVTVLGIGVLDSTAGVAAEKMTDVMVGRSLVEAVRKIQRARNQGRQ